MERLAAHPHHVGSPWGKANAEWMRDQFRSWGWESELAEYHVLFPTPKERVLELVAPTRFVAKLAEPVIATDPTTRQQSEQLPTYNSYSGEGDVTGPLVYVNYGVPSDYEELEKRGISVRGAIVIARYGGSWRGIKPKLAAEHGASAASSIPIRAMTAITRAMRTRSVPGVHATAYSAGACSTCLSRRAIRSR